MNEEDVAALLDAITKIADQIRDLSDYEVDMLFASAREALDDREEDDLLARSVLSGIRLGRRSASSIGRELPA
ncbi:hypothetical protein [Paracoccus sp. ME4]|uniref:hypothetical protein n=1 Tax=Paracoccus sp. ME4 TaxID=3138066 RepID=UPI00398AE593